MNQALDIETYGEHCCSFVRKKKPVIKDTRDLLNKVHVKYNTWKQQCLIATADS